MSKAYSSVLLWQGFNHKWDYNHRVKRLGSYVHHVTDHGGPRKAVIGHTGASGWGDDELKFVDYYADVDKAAGVWFQTGYCDFEVECTRLRHNEFEEVFTAPLDEAMRGLDDYVVVLNGFDLKATDIADKLMDMELEVADVKPGDTSITFKVRGYLQFDCRSLECLSDDFSKRNEDEKSAFRREIQALLDLIDLGDQIDTSSPEKFFASLKEVMAEAREIIEDTEKERELRRYMRRIEDAQPELARDIGAYLANITRVKPLLGSKTTKDLAPRVTPYTLRVHFAIAGGNADALHVCRDFKMEPDSNEYAWTLKKEVKAKDKGRVGGTFTGIEDRFAHDVPALTRLWLQLRIDPTVHHHANQGVCEAMHMLALNMAVHSPQRKNGTVDVALDLFFKAWEKGMETGHVGSSGSHPLAGSAKMGAEAVLLQFDGQVEPKTRVGTIPWGGIIDPEQDNPENKAAVEGVT